MTDHETRIRELFHEELRSEGLSSNSVVSRSRLDELMLRAIHRKWAEEDPASAPGGR